MSYDAPGYPTLTYSQLEQVWIDAGGQQSMAPLMAAIAMAESGGHAGAINPTDTKEDGTTQTSWGLWQISTGNHNMPAPNTLDPVVNAKLAIQKIQSQGLGAWSTYDDGSYRQFYEGSVPPGNYTPGSSANNAGYSMSVQPASSGSGSGGSFWDRLLAGLNPFSNDNGQGILSVAPGVPNKDLPPNFNAGPQNPIAAIGQGLDKFVTLFRDITAVFVWLANPSNWLRIGAAIVGIIAFAFGGYLFATAR